ncbi:MAG: hypothetical protein GXP10_06865 [Gammaproteobacteria bacterium]|nr:hypothetical protein [Gammaproteobacteria bacterium]
MSTLYPKIVCYDPAAPSITSRLRLAILCALLLTQPAFAAGPFALNFQPLDATFGDDNRADTSCNRPDVADRGCSGSWSNSGDPTAFLQELITVDGSSYYHVIIGLPEDGFAQEYVAQVGGPSWEGASGSNSLGDGICRSGFGPGNFVLSACNISDPLGVTHDNVFTGVGSGNPKAVVMRQVNGGTWDGASNSWSCAASDNYCSEFKKENFLYKPVITQTINEASEYMNANFSFDMSAIDYDTNTTAGTMVNTVTISDPTLDDYSIGAGDFNYATDADSNYSTLSGGRYIFTGSGPTNANLEPYEYIDGDFALDREWSEFKN